MRDDGPAAAGTFDRRADLFRVGLGAVASILVGGDRLVIESWPGGGVTTRRRR